MKSKYAAIRKENKLRYGTDIGRIGTMLLADRYADRTHFIYELLQNAEDALARRHRWHGSRAVSFDVTDRTLSVSHFGVPFDEADVRGICGIANSAKDESSIGRFGIGFKSVYAITDRPEIHSGIEDFAIEKFVWPIETAGIRKDPDETTIRIPFQRNVDSEEIISGLERLDASSLLFLRNIDEIRWTIQAGSQGNQVQKTQHISPTVSLGSDNSNLEADKGKLKTDNSNLEAGNGKPAADNGDGIGPVTKVGRSQLFVFFQTAVETHLGFLMQGPYRTTPSRDNVRRDDSWNERCVKETDLLLIDSLLWLRDRGRLDADVLRCLPLDPQQFDERSMFSPLFQSTKEALTARRLLPSYGGGHTSAKHARLSRSLKLRELFNPQQLSELLATQDPLVWLTTEISQDRTPELLRYLTHELQVEEISPQKVLRRLNLEFLEAQSDAWVCKLYEFLEGQKALHTQARKLPLIRLRDGSHVSPILNGQLQAFLPGDAETDFPTVHLAVCRTKQARDFLDAMGMKRPDPVDDIIRNVLPKYNSRQNEITSAEYDKDIRRIVYASKTNNKRQQKRLIDNLSRTSLVRSIDGVSAQEKMCNPSVVYLPTDRLVQLFEGVPDVLFVSDRYECLRGATLRKLLQECGAIGYLRPVSDRSFLDDEESKRKLRERSGHPKVGRIQNVEDWSLHGLRPLLDRLRKMPQAGRQLKAGLLWDELADLAATRPSVFRGTYSWTHYGNRSQPLDSAFVRLLNSTQWVPDSDGQLQVPGLMQFDSLDWQQNTFLQSAISFKQPAIDQLARETGIDPEALDFLRKHSITADQLQKLVRPTVQGVDPDVERPRPRRPAPAARLNRRREFVSYVGVHAEKREPDPHSRTYLARMNLEAKATELIMAREPQWQPTRTGNRGFDLFEAGPDGRPIRWCEVKAMSGALDDRPVGLSHTQFDFARERGKDFWLYIVEHANEQHARIIRINDPAGRARTFTFDRGWIDVAEIDDTR